MLERERGNEDGTRTKREEKEGAQRRTRKDRKGKHDGSNDQSIRGSSFLVFGVSS